VHPVRSLPGQRSVFGARVSLDGKHDCRAARLKLDISTWPAGAICLRVSGDVDLATVPQLSEAIQSVVEQAPGGLVLDLDSVTFFGAAGVRALILAKRKCGDAGIDFSILHCSRSVSRVLELTGTAHSVGLA
jgi:anti-sigma B factor antagonist